MTISFHYPGKTPRECLAVVQNSWLHDWQIKRARDLAQVGSDDECKIYLAALERDANHSLNLWKDVPMSRGDPVMLALHQEHEVLTVWRCRTSWCHQVSDHIGVTIVPCSNCGVESWERLTVLVIAHEDESDEITSRERALFVALQRCEASRSALAAELAGKL